MISFLKRSFREKDSLPDVLLPFFFISVTFILYHSSLNNFYVLDDFVRLRVASEGLLYENFHFFPLPLIFYRLIYIAFGTSPFAERFLSYLLNAFMCILVYNFAKLATELFARDISEQKRKIIALITSLLFCVNYIHVETIIYYSELHEMFYSIFYLSGLYFYFLQRKYPSGRIYSALVTISFFCCILSKETAVTFLFVIFLLEKFFYKKNLKAVIKNNYWLVIVTLGFVLTRFLFFNRTDVLNKPESFLSVIAEIIKNYLFSLSSIFVSLDFIFIKNIYKANNSNIINAFSELISKDPLTVFLIISSLLIYIFLLIKPTRLKILLILFFIITVSSYAWLTGYERYLYLPSVFIWLLFSYTIFTNETLNKFNRAPLYILLGGLIVYNILNLKDKQDQWNIASEISRQTVNRISDVTKDLPPGAEVYFQNVPGEYKSAWILRYGIHELPKLFINRPDLKFFYIYQFNSSDKSENQKFIYDYSADQIIKQ